jgi:hypothetical protein
MKLRGTSRTTKSARLVTLAALLGVLGVGVGAGIAVAKTSAPAVPAPTITSSPPNPSNSTSASFSFTDSKSGVTFMCSLDSAAYTACSSPKTYSGLSAATHTFKVKAVSGADSSSESVYTWAIDTTAPPAPAIGDKPANPSNSTSPTFSFTDTEAGVTFLCKLDGAAFSSCVSPKTYSGLAQGAHTFTVEARDAAGNTSSTTSYGWTVDTTAPAAPTFTQQPSNPSPSPTVTFAWTDSSSDVASYRCSRENGSFTPCTSPFSYTVDNSNPNGQHQFAVQAFDTAGNGSVVTSYTFKVGGNDNKPFTISGSVTGLQIGAPKAVPLTLTNPNNQTIFVTSLTISAGNASAACDSSNIQVTPSTASATNPITVPANGSVTLSGSLAAFAPKLTLVDKPNVNQNACKNTSFALTYSGSAHS